MGGFSYSTISAHSFSVEHALIVINFTGVTFNKIKKGYFYILF